MPVEYNYLAVHYSNLSLLLYLAKLLHSFFETYIGDNGLYTLLDY